jgi:hypothetical protein
MRLVRLSALALLIGFPLAGCASVTRAYPGEDPGQVWTALVAVARTPDYDDPDPNSRWTVRENEVREFRDEGRIEIYRRLARHLHRPDTITRPERRTWRIRVVLDAGEPPTARFTIRGWTIPARVIEEGERYFDDVRRLLGAPPPDLAPLPDAPAPEPPPADAAPAEPPPDPPAPDDGPDLIDLDEVEPGG